eukprot:gene34509-54170_t
MGQRAERVSFVMEKEMMEGGQTHGRAGLPSCQATAAFTLRGRGEI